MSSTIREVQTSIATRLAKDAWFAAHGCTILKEDRASDAQKVAERIPRMACGLLITLPKGTGHPLPKLPQLLLHLTWEIQVWANPATTSGQAFDPMEGAERAALMMKLVPSLDPPLQPWTPGTDTVDVEEIALDMLDNGEAAMPMEVATVRCRAEALFQGLSLGQ